MISKNGSNTIVRTVRVLEQVYSPQLDNQRDILVYLPPEYNQSAARYPVIIIHQDPVLSQVKLIAEPWDVGPGGYQVGNFPVLWAEWKQVPRHGTALLEGRRGADRRAGLPPERVE